MVSQMLSELGFNLHLMGSERYVREKLESLNPLQVSKLKESFIKNKHPRFKKEMAASRRQPFGKASEYVKSIRNADVPKIAKLLKIVGMLLQTKVYLFWNQSPWRNSKGQKVYSQSGLTAKVGLLMLRKKP